MSVGSVRNRRRLLLALWMLFATTVCLTAVVAFVPRTMNAAAAVAAGGHRWDCRENNHRFESASSSHGRHDRVRLLSAASDDGGGGGGGDDAAATTANQAYESEFRNLVHQVMTTRQPEHVPRLLANNIELITRLNGKEGAQLISDILEDAASKDRSATTTTTTTGEDEEEEDVYSQTLRTIETILSFAEDFVKQAQKMDDNHKQLLGEIMRAMVSPENDQSVSGTDGRSSVYDRSDPDGLNPSPTTAPRAAGDARSREAALDRVMREEKDRFTAGFLKHLEGECDRIARRSTVTPESEKLMEIMRMIQTRVLEEVGKDLGEGALVLGQLLGYEKDEELLGVLDAGLTVRGAKFAAELAGLTEEALEGFRQVPGGADPGLVEKVRLIDRRLNEFLGGGGGGTNGPTEFS